MGLLLAPIVLLTASSAPVQMGRTWVTLEAQVGTAAVVALGRIEGVEHVELSPRGGTYDRTIWPDGWYRTIIRFRASEPIKGKAPKELKLALESHGKREQFDVWMEHRASLLLFLADPIQPVPDQNWRLFRLAPLNPAENRFHGSEWTSILGMDLRVLDTAELIVARAKDFVKRHPGKVSTFAVDRAPARSPNLPPPADANRTIFPRVPEMRKIAQDLFAPSSPEHLRGWGKDILKEMDPKPGG